MFYFVLTCRGVNHIFLVMNTFLLLCLYILIVMNVLYILFSSYHLAFFGYPLTGVSPCFFLSCKAYARV